MTTLLPARASAETAVRARSAATDCCADADGGLVLETAALPPETQDAFLVLRRRGSGAAPGESGPADEVRLPFSPTAEGRFRAVLPADLALAEGRWDATAEAPGQTEPRRLEPGVLDLRMLLGRVPAGEGPVRSRIPYATKHGNLSLRIWQRTAHAEAGELRLEPGRMTLHGRLHRATADERCVLELHGRHEAAPVVTVPVEVTGSGFSAQIPLSGLVAAGPGTWDLWLLPQGTGGGEGGGDDTCRVRVACLLDDVADKKPVLVYPAVPVDAEGGAGTARPYYTLDNDLAVTVAGVRRS